MQPDLIAKRIRNNLLTQKKRLEQYLIVLEKEEEDIIKKDPDKLIQHINIEKHIVNDLLAFKKILEPLEIMYYNTPYKKNLDIDSLKKSINTLSGNVKNKAGNNKLLLNTLLEKTNEELNGLKKSNYIKTSYNTIDSKLIDLNG